MSELHLHKKKEYTFQTLKNTIVLDLDKVKESHEYEENIIKKTQKYLKIIGKNQMDFWHYNLRFFYFPVKEIIICNDINTYSKAFIGFNNAKEIKVQARVKYINIVDNLGMRYIENITIPFTINKFVNKCDMTKNNLQTITVYNNKDKITIGIDEIFEGKEINIIAENKDDYLNIKNMSDKIDIEYNVYLKDDKLTYDKKYNKYEINNYDEKPKEINIIELKNKYNEISFRGNFYHVKKIILGKNDLEFLTKDIFRFLNEIEIIEDNDMSLFPKKVNIRFEELDKYELLKDNLFIKIDRYNKYIIVNNDLSVILLNSVEKIILDYNINNFKYENNILSIPFNKYINDITQSTLLNEIIRKCYDIKVCKNEKMYTIETMDLSDIKYVNENQFITEYLALSLIDCGDAYYKFIENYNFNESKKFQIRLPKEKVLKKDLIKTKLPRKR